MVVSQLVAVLVVLLSMLAGGSHPPRSSRTASASHHRPALALHVSGNHLVNAHGQRVRLIGFNNSGAEYACVEGWGIFDDKAPDDTAVPTAQVEAMTRWAGANAVRLQLNEQCWRGAGIDPRYGGASYRHAIRTYVRQLTAHGLAVILDLHVNAPGTERATNQEPMPDRRSVGFWKQVASSFRSNRAVVFDLFNEPWPDNQATDSAAWRCWRDGGCTVTSTNGGRTYRAVGMNRLIAAVRSTGARNVVMAGGVNYAADLNKWLAFKPHDPKHQLAASVHIYSFNRCTTTTCLDEKYGRVAKKVPLVIGELGPDLTVGWSPSLNSGCGSDLVGHTGFDHTVISWARAHAASWTAWTWNAWGNCWALITDYAGHPTSPYGTTVRKALAANRSSHRS